MLREVGRPDIEAGIRVACGWVVDDVVQEDRDAAVVRRDAGGAAVRRHQACEEQRRQQGGGGTRATHWRSIPHRPRLRLLWVMARKLLVFAVFWLVLPTNASAGPVQVMPGVTYEHRI